MKYLFLLLVALPLFSFTSCEKEVESRKRTIMFHTDALKVDQSYNLLYIEGELSGTLSMTSNPNCGALGTTNYEMFTDTKLDIEVRNADGDAKYFGTISLDNWSSGLGVQLAGSEKGNVIRVDGTSSDECTKVYLGWV